jgi:hypothetical protein
MTALTIITSGYNAAIISTTFFIIGRSAIIAIKRISIWNLDYGKPNNKYQHKNNISNHKQKLLFIVFLNFDVI